MLHDIYEITQGSLERLYNFTIDSGGNLIVFGPSGVGKTIMAMQAAKRLETKYIYLNLSVLESPDMIGLPQMKDDRTTFSPPDFFPLAKDGGGPVTLLLDEIDKAKDELQNPCLELFQFRSINGRALNIKSIIATGNLPNEHAKSRVISWALANRCNIYRVGCDYEHWRKWAVDNDINPLIIGFLGQRSDLLLKPNDSGDPTAYCHPSPRSWTLAAKDIDMFAEHVKRNPEEFALDPTADKDPVIDFQCMLVAGRVGIKAALDFKIWLKFYRFLGPDIDALIEHGTFPDPNTMTLDHVMVFGIAGVSALNKACKANDSNRVERTLDNVFNWLLSDQVTPDQCFSIMKSTLSNSFVETHDLLAYQTFEDVFDKIGESIKLL
ncbi:hypothetical protein LCGC14_0478680 [marine sediment metagenome]|uniref:AAA+ ATPase domain-containing protein n=1 Tax=marine sediment metagenome TaxID=412755 RepID=A0A0F9SFC5_9ZZZZ